MTAIVTMDNNTFEVEMIMMLMALSISIHFGYFLLLIKVISNEEAWRRKPINFMIVFNEVVKLICSVTSTFGIAIVSLLKEASHQPGDNYIGNGSLCQSYVYLGILGGFWNIIDGAGM